MGSRFPKQWKLIALYMAIAFIAFVICIEYARRHPLPL